MSTLTFDRWALTWQLQTGKTDDVVTDQLVARTWLASMVPGVLLAIAIVITVAGSVANLAVLTAAADLQGDPTAFTLELGPSLVIGAAGLVCAAMAQAFAHGIKLVDDVEGLV